LLSARLTCHMPTVQAPSYTRHLHWEHSKSLCGAMHPSPGAHQLERDFAHLADVEQVAGCAERSEFCQFAQPKLAAVISS